MYIKVCLRETIYKALFPKFGYHCRSDCFLLLSTRVIVFCATILTTFMQSYTIAIVHILRPDKAKLLDSDESFSFLYHLFWFGYFSNLLVPLIFLIQNGLPLTGVV